MNSAPQQRGSFQSTLVFILASLGSAVGMANLIAFPPLLAQYGLPFLVVYLAFTLTIGIPLMSMEIAIGHRTKASPIVAYETLGGRKWRVPGIVNIICCFVLFGIFVVLFTWTSRYFAGFVFNTAPENFGGYLQAHPVEIILIATGLIVVNVIVVALGVSNGIGRVSKIVVPVFGIMLLFFALRNLSNWNAVVTGFGDTFKKIPKDSSAWMQMLSSALGQAFFSLSLGAGTMLMYGSYLKSDTNLQHPKKVVTLSNIIVQCDTAVGLICCLFVLPLGLPMEEGVGLIFGTLFQYFSGYSQLLGGIFFLCLSFIALTMTISVFEPVVGSLVEIYKKQRWTAALIAGGASVLLIIPMALSFGANEDLTNLITGSNGGSKSFFFLAFDIFINIALPFSGLLTILFVNRKWSLQSFEKEGGLDTSSVFVRKYMKICATFITPALLAVLLVIKLVDFFRDIA
jgi:NSS family neurotransmitter:Na+ symporter